LRKVGDVRPPEVDGRTAVEVLHRDAHVGHAQQIIAALVILSKINAHIDQQLQHCASMTNEPVQDSHS
jgi:hypothetical protein